jgi:hypothetical protein
VSHRRVTSRSRTSRLIRIVIITVVALSGAGCGSGTKSAGTSATAAATTIASPTDGDDAANRATVVSFTVQQGTILGYTLDVDCVTKVVAQLSAADAALLAASTVDTAPDATSPILSAAGDALGTKVDDCAIGSTDTELVAKAIETVMSSAGGSGLDRSCVEAAFAKLSDTQLELIVNSATDSTDPLLQPIGATLFDCVLTPESDGPTTS